MWYLLWSVDMHMLVLVLTPSGRGFSDNTPGYLTILTLHAQLESLAFGRWLSYWWLCFALLQSYMPAELAVHACVHKISALKTSGSCRCYECNRWELISLDGWPLWPFQQCTIQTALLGELDQLAAKQSNYVCICRRSTFRGFLWR